MYQKKKERLYISELLDDPSVTYPSYYALSTSMMYLDVSGWKGMPCTEDIFKLENWTVC